MNRWRTLSLFAVIVCSVFIAGAVDILFPDVIPIRPYTSFFLTNLQERPVMLSSGPSFWGGLPFSMIGPVLMIAIIFIVLVAFQTPMPPLIIGPHGKSDTSHSKWHDKMAKKSVAKRILKRIKESERVQVNVSKAATGQTQKP